MISVSVTPVTDITFQKWGKTMITMINSYAQKKSNSVSNHRYISYAQDCMNFKQQDPDSFTPSEKYLQSKSNNPSFKGHLFILKPFKSIENLILGPTAQTTTKTSSEATVQSLIQPSFKY